jgi:hypothetical protein
MKFSSYVLPALLRQFLSYGHTHFLLSCVSSSFLRSHTLPSILRQFLLLTVIYLPNTVSKHFHFMFSVSEKTYIAHTNYRTNSMELNPSDKLIVRSASETIPRLLRNPKIYYRVHNSPPPVHILSHLNPVHTHKPCFTTTHFNIILPPTPKFFEWSFSWSFKRIPPSPRHCVTFHNMMVTAGSCWAPVPTPKLEHHPLSAVRDFLFNIQRNKQIQFS